MDAQTSKPRNDSNWYNKYLIFTFGGAFDGIEEVIKAPSWWKSYWFLANEADKYDEQALCRNSPRRFAKPMVWFLNLSDVLPIVANLETIRCNCVEKHLNAT